MPIQSLAATAAVTLFPIMLVYAGVMDIFTMKIRNILILALAASWLLLAPIAGFDVAELGMSLAMSSLIFVITFFMFALGWIGGGDAKLAAASALWFSPEEVLLYFSYAGLIGGVLTLLVLQLRSSAMPAVLYGVEWINRLRDRKAGVPYGAAMAPAALIVFPQTDWVLRASF